MNEDLLYKIVDVVSATGLEMPSGKFCIKLKTKREFYSPYINDSVGNLILFDDPVAVANWLTENYPGTDLNFKLLPKKAPEDNISLVEKANKFSRDANYATLAALKNIRIMLDETGIMDCDSLDGDIEDIEDSLKNYDETMDLIVKSLKDQQTQGEVK